LTVEPVEKVPSSLLLRIFKTLTYREYATILENTCASNLEPFGQALNDKNLRKKYFFDRLCGLYDRVESRKNTKNPKCNKSLRVFILYSGKAAPTMPHSGKAAAPLCKMRKTLPAAPSRQMEITFDCQVHCIQSSHHCQAIYSLASSLHGLFCDTYLDRCCLLLKRGVLWIDCRALRRLLGLLSRRLS